MLLLRLMRLITLLMIIIIEGCCSIGINNIKKSLSIAISSSLLLNSPPLVNAANIDPTLSPSQLIQRGMKSFSNGQLLSSVEYFDEAKSKDPSIENYLWQRGLSLYYMNEFEDCANQFKKDVIVNKDDTEEAIWNMACQTQQQIEKGKEVKDALEIARKNMFNIENEKRPIMNVAYEVFKGKQPIDKLIESAGTKNDLSVNYFYSKLYQSLLKDIEQDKLNGLLLMQEALDSAYAKNSNDYMVTLAKNHVKIRQMEMEQ